MQGWTYLNVRDSHQEDNEELMTREMHEELIRSPDVNLEMQQA